MGREILNIFEIMGLICLVIFFIFFFIWLLAQISPDERDRIVNSDLREEGGDEKMKCKELMVALYELELKMQVFDDEEYKNGFCRGYFRGYLDALKDTKKIVKKILIGG